MDSGVSDDQVRASLAERLAEAEREIVSLRIRLYEAEHWNSTVEASFRFRLGRALVDAFTSLGAAAKLPRTLAEIAGDGYREHRERRRLLSDGLPLPAPNPGGYQPVSGRILYLLHSSYPYHPAGYAVRSHRLIRAMTSRGIDVHPFTRLGYPVDMADGIFSAGGEDAPAADRVDDVTYRRLPMPPTRIGRRAGFGQAAYLRRYGVRVEQEARALRPAVIHAASNYQNGLAAAHAGRALGAPVLYEVRGLWDLTRIAREPGWEGSAEHRLFHRLETQAAREADHVVTLTDGLKAEFVSRGVEPARITVIPNCVDAHAFAPRPRDPELLRSLDLEEKLVIGYVGSLIDYEGMDLLVRAFSKATARHPDLRLLLVGDGRARAGISRAIRDSGVEERCRMVGAVAASDVPRYYSLIDVAPFPRRGLAVCELVSPLKPLEAMAAEKAVLVSDVAALAEMVVDGATGLVHRKDDAESLASALLRLADDADLRHRLGRAARAWVARERTWEMAAGRFADLYAMLEERRREDATLGQRTIAVT